MQHKTRIACITSDLKFLNELKENMTIDFHTNSLLKFKEYLQYHSCDELYVTTALLDAEFKDLVPYARKMKLIVKTNWNSSAFNTFLKENNIHRYQPIVLEMKELLFQTSKLDGYTYIKDIVLYLMKQDKNMAALEEALQMVQIKYNVSNMQIRRSIRYYIQILFNQNKLDMWFQDMPKVDEFISFHFDKISKEHYMYQ